MFFPDYHHTLIPLTGRAYLTVTELFKCVAWMPHGRSWMVLDRELFVDRALPKYFNHKNFTSFVRIGESSHSK